MERDLAAEDEAIEPWPAGPYGPEHGQPDQIDQVESDEATPEQVDPASLTAIDAVDALLDEVERALGRIDAGVYGRCEQCGGVIDDDRLSGAPTARTCGACPPPPAD